MLTRFLIPFIDSILEIILRLGLTKTPLYLDIKIPCADGFDCTGRPNIKKRIYAAILCGDRHSKQSSWKRADFSLEMAKFIARLWFSLAKRA
jgi:hypothetical protein